MALGGYGPLQYEVLAQRAVRYKPPLMLVGIYFGNDFYDNWEMYLRSPSRYPVPKELLNSALKAGATLNPLSLEVEDFYGIGPTDAERQTDAEKERAWSLRYFLAQNSSLWGLARAVKNKLFPPRTVLSDEFETAVAALTPKQLEYASIFDGMRLENNLNIAIPRSRREHRRPYNQSWDLAHSIGRTKYRSFGERK